MEPAEEDGTEVDGPLQEGLQRDWVGDMESPAMPGRFTQSDFQTSFLLPSLLK